mgnify:CR=1 FL=1
MGYLQSELLDFKESNDSDHVKSKLLIEYDRVLKSIDRLRNELHIYELYLDKFPVLSESIMKFIIKKQKEMLELSLLISKLMEEGRMQEGIVFDNDK